MAPWHLKTFMGRCTWWSWKSSSLNTYTLSNFEENKANNLSNSQENKPSNNMLSNIVLLHVNEKRTNGGFFEGRSWSFLAFSSQKSPSLPFWITCRVVDHARFTDYSRGWESPPLLLSPPHIKTYCTCKGERERCLKERFL